MRAGHGTEHLLDRRRHARMVGRALEDPGLHARVRDAFGDVADEPPCEHVGEVAAAEAGAHLDEVRQLGEGVVAGGDDDVERGLFGDSLHERDVAPEPGHGEVDDRADARVDELVHADDRGFDVAVGVEAFDVGVVDDELVAQDEHVLVGEHLAEVGGVDRAANGFDVGHGPTLRRTQLGRSRKRARLSRMTVFTWSSLKFLS